MTLKTADLIFETTASVGSGPFVLSGAVAGHRAFADSEAWVVGDSEIGYCVRDAVNPSTGLRGPNWMTASGTLSSASILTADVVYSGSAGPGVPVSFGAGAKDIYSCIPATLLNSLAAAGAGPDVTPPLPSNAQVANGAATVVRLVFNEAMNQTSTPAGSAFTVGGHTVASVAWISSSVLGITVSAAFVNGEAARTLAYVAPGSNPLRDIAGNNAASFSGLAITNNVAAGGGGTAPAFTAAATISGTPTVGSAISYTSTITGSPTPTVTQQWTLDGAPISGATGGTYTPVSGDVGHALRVVVTAHNTTAPDAVSTSAPVTVVASGGLVAVRLDTFVGVMTESGDGTAGWTYTGNNSGTFNDTYGASVLSLPANTDGYFRATMNSPLTGAGSTPFGLIGLSTSATNNDYTNWEYVFTQNNTGTPGYQAIFSGTNEGAAGGGAPVAGDFFLIRRVAGTLTAEVSHDGGSTYTVVHTFTTTSTARLYLHGSIYTFGIIGNLRGSGVS